VRRCGRMSQMRWTLRTPRPRRLPSITWSWSPRGVSVTTKAWGMVGRLSWPGPPAKRPRRRR
jgi:hypothetical protein